VIWRRNRFQGTGSIVSETGSKNAGTRNRFVNILSLTHCIICIIRDYSSIMKAETLAWSYCVLVFHFFIHRFIRCSASCLQSRLPGGYLRRLKFLIFVITYWLYFARRLSVCLPVCLFVRKMTQKLLRRLWWKFACGLSTLQNWSLNVTVTKTFVTITK